MSGFFKRLWQDNPARVVSSTLALIPLTFAFLTSFGVIFTEEQQTSIAGLLFGIAALLGFGGEVIRSQVSPVGKVQPLLNGHDRLQTNIDNIDVNATKQAIVRRIRQLQSSRDRGALTVSDVAVVLAIAAIALVVVVLIV
jgi:hypothetical protein